MMTKRSAGRGYSLVEVLIAVAITGVVMLTIVTLFYMGRRNVYSGKQMTYAVSVGTRVMEDLSTMTDSDLLTAFGITDGEARQTVVVCQNKLLPLGTSTCSSNIITTFTNSTERETGTISPTTDPSGYLAQWAALVTGANLTNGKVGLVFTPRSAADNTKLWTTARFTRVRVYVQWDEAKNRTRLAFFDTTKVNRE
jgi:prepilin-type N-terminal cleavage/methylation domain-containing protein